MKILLAEDDSSLAKATAGMLSHKRNGGHDVSVAKDGNAALDMLGKTRYDVVLLDVMMPGHDGFEILETIRKHDTMTPVLMVTAKGSVEDTVTGLEKGADGYIVKPCPGAELVARINAAVRSRNAHNKKFNVAGVIVNCDDSSLNTENASLNLGYEELEILKMFATTDQKAVGDITKDAGIEEDALILYVSYINKKLGSLGSVHSFNVIDGICRIEAPHE